MKTDRLQAFFWAIRSNKIFETSVILIIIASALLIGVKTYDISPLALKIINLVDWAITFFFLTEVIIRYLGEEHKAAFFRKGWNIFDCLIVTASLLPVENSEMALLGRLIRVFRVLRMVSIVPEMRLLLDALLKALPQLGYVVALMFIIFYIYGAVGSMFFAKINNELWGDISISMLTLFRVMTFEDWTDIMYETMTIYPLSWMYYLSFIFFTAFAFLNMVIGIVVNTLHEESDRVRLEQQGLNAVSLNEIHDEIKELKLMLATTSTSTSVATAKKEEVAI